jgi:prevent-host-death family protein
VPDGSAVIFGLGDARERLGALVDLVQDGTDIILTRRGELAVRITAYVVPPLPADWVPTPTVLHRGGETLTVVIVGGLDVRVTHARGKSIIDDRIVFSAKGQRAALTTDQHHAAVWQVEWLINEKTKDGWTLA